MCYCILFASPECPVILGANIRKCDEMRQIQALSYLYTFLERTRSLEAGEIGLILNQNFVCSALFGFVDMRSAVRA